MPGSTAKMHPRPDPGETSYKGSGRLQGKRAIITGGDSGIGRAVAIAFAREGADILIAYLDETDDAKEVAAIIEKEGRKAVLVEGDLDEEWRITFEVNFHAIFFLAKAAVRHMTPGGSIINTASVNADMPDPILLAYATTKVAIQNFTGGLAQMLAEKGIRVNPVAPGPIWTPLIPSTMPDDAVKNFGKQMPMKRAGQPAELATAYVMLADPLSSYTSGTTIAVTGGKPFI
jgi:NAD(P)-dependent dehydrogenase (short-subunit alcohol dehydrogenase family)